MQKAKAALVVIVVVGGFIAILLFLCFTTFDIPSDLATPGATTQKHRALVLKVFRHDWLRAGQLILVATLQDDKPSRTIKKLERVDKPTRPRQTFSFGRRRTHISTDPTPPTYWIVPGADTNYLASIKVSDIEGLVVWVRK